MYVKFNCDVEWDLDNFIPEGTVVKVAEYNVLSDRRYTPVVVDTVYNAVSDKIRKIIPTVESFNNNCLDVVND